MRADADCELFTRVVPSSYDPVIVKHDNFQRIYKKLNYNVKKSTKSTKI